jgi:hypothetical protein
MSEYKKSIESDSIVLRINKEEAEILRNLLKTSRHLDIRQNGRESRAYELKNDLIMDLKCFVWDIDKDKLTEEK